jgi:RNase H-like domain found in reverse transcriptase/Integrase zinc binding domain
VVKKQDGDYRLINAAMEINRHTIKDANLPPSADDFAEEFAGLATASYLDWFSGYDQMCLAERSRDMTAIMTPIGLLRHTTILQGAINSVAQFVRVVLDILRAHIPDIALPFMDDIGVKGPRSRYKEEEIPGLPGVRRFVMEHIQNLDAVLADLERAGVTLSGEKCKFCMAGLKIVGYVCDADGRHPDFAKIAKIIEWPPCNNPTDVKAFLGVTGYYRIWVLDYSIIARPLTLLLRKEEEFIWDTKQQYAMDLLKMALTTAPALRTIVYNEGEIILAVDASLLGWGCVLMQIYLMKRHPARYESGLWNNAQQKYDAGKRECLGVLMALKKLRNWLYGVRFILEIDALTLAAQLNRSAGDLPSALVTRWLAWIHLFDFDVRHVAGTKHTAADGLSRRPGTVLDQVEQQDVEDYIDAQLFCLRAVPRPAVATKMTVMMCPVSESNGDVPDFINSPTVAEIPEMEVQPQDDEPLDFEDLDGPLDSTYGPAYQQIAQYLLDLQKPEGMEAVAFRKFKVAAHRFQIFQNQLFRRESKNVPMRRVIDGKNLKNKVLYTLHEQTGHRGREGTYRKIADRYWWPALYKDVANHCKTCAPCQMRRPNTEEEALHPTYVSVMWQKVHMDAVYMNFDRDHKYLVTLRDDLSGWIEAEPLKELNGPAVVKFVTKVVQRFGIFSKLVVDGGPENRALLGALTEKYGINKVTTSSYHPQANGMEEVGHRPIKDALSKLYHSGKGGWLANLGDVLWADRVTIRRPTGMSAFRICFGYDPILPIEEELPTWSFLKWSEVQTRGELLTLRALQLRRRDEDVDEASLRLRRMREQAKEQFDETHIIREKELEVGNLVLLYNSRNKTNFSRKAKFSFRWLGPYKISHVTTQMGSYHLEELDGTRLVGTYAGNRLKLFHERLQEDRAEGDEPIVSLDDAALDIDEEDDMPEDSEVIGPAAAVILRRAEQAARRAEDAAAAIEQVRPFTIRLPRLPQADRERYDG